MTTYSQAVAAIHALPRLAKSGGHERITALLAALGDPQRGRYVHVTGTNGKGSVANAIAHMLSATGLTVGLFTSPFIMRFNERIAIDGQPIADADLALAYDAGAAALKRLQAQQPGFGVTEFEFITAIAFWFFAEQRVDVAVIEVGIGGDTDSTNVIDPLVSVITSVGLDHAKLLGNTLTSVATHKAGIIKPNRPVVTAALPAAAAAVVAARAQATGSRWLLEDRDFAVGQAKLDGWGQRFDYRDADGRLGDLRIPLVGPYQVQNAGVAIRAAKLAASALGVPLPAAAVRRGLAQSTWPARMEQLSADPLIVIDGAHNPQGIQSLIDALHQVFGRGPLTLIIGALADKDVKTMLSLLERTSFRLWLVPVPDNPRATALGDYPDQARLATFADWQSALAAHLADYRDEPVVIAGSLYLAAAVRQTLLA
ncbi:bifunctional folylpolyglutamate synthase/dihydrofolate synthase [Lacticaseibacillus parakribbianus]|uniref:bifunctional folylpolyglutamate synthase/dihydrofolate synthase n=1 Tax=Lacticaseibacillus parakribbianus TaxID=2970927 RepID=UPI0021CB22DB|nr:folylpolyglutamate synthase/dihydrofolate synthase family protein [Lacticaseibacillus parakribbianus]